MAKLVSKTYGEALFEVAQEANQTREFMEEIRALQEVLAENPEFDKMMVHPGVSKQEKAAAVEAIFRGRISDELTGFLSVVVEKERYCDLPDIFKYFMDRVKEENKIGVAYVTTAVELTELQKENVKKRLLETTTYESVEIYYEVDTTLIGGMIIRINDRVVDSSIRTKMNELTKQLLQIQLG